MRLDFVSTVFALLLVSVLVSVASAEDQPKSNVIAQRDHSFWLTVRDDSLVLATQSAKKESVNHRRLSFNIPKDGRVTEMRLEPWVSNRGLCAVVEVSVGNEYQYSRVTLVIRPAGYSSASALFHTSAEDLSILAVNGTFRGDSVLALLGVGTRKGSDAGEGGSGRIRDGALSGAHLQVAAQQLNFVPGIAGMVCHNGGKQGFVGLVHQQCGQEAGLPIQFVAGATSSTRACRGICTGRRCAAKLGPSPPGRTEATPCGLQTKSRWSPAPVMELALR